MRRDHLLASSLFLFVAPGCRRPAAEPPARAIVEAAPRAGLRPKETKEEKSGVSSSEARPPQRCFPGDQAAASPRPLGDLLDRAADRFDAEDFNQSLVCAEEAARGDPRSIEAQHDRAAALAELDRLDEAKDAFARALAIDPDDPETLAGAADFFVNRLPGSNDHSETGLEYARRGSRLLRRHRAAQGRGHDRVLRARLALIEGQALNDLGRAREALSRLDAAAGEAGAGDDVRVRFERASSLFELCRFAEARRGFEQVIAQHSDDAWSHHHLGQTLERLGDDAGAEREFARARQLAPADFHPPILLPAAEFRALVDEEVAKLPSRLRDDLSRAQLETADLPEVADLTAEEPPLSPTILGLYRGAPLDDPRAGRDEARTIVIYRKTLARAVATRDELRAQVRTTLLHELGHLRGEDDDALRARGLE